MIWIFPVLLASLLACTSTLDVERAKEILNRGGPPEVPLIGEETTPSLPAVEGLRAISGELREVPLQWDPSFERGVAGYVVERALESDGPFSRIATIAGRFRTTHVDRGSDLGPKRGHPGVVADLGDGESYYYRVRAYRSDGRIAAETSKVVPAQTAPRPDPPLDLRAYSQLPREIALSWRPSTDPSVAGYVVYRSPSATGEYQNVGRLHHRYATSFVDRGLGSLRVFYYRVAAVNRAGGEGPPTESVRGLTKPNPLPPVGLVMTEQRVGVNRIAWQPNVEADIAHYEVFRLREGAADAELVARVEAPETMATDRGVGAGEVVEYSVVAVDGDGLRSSRSETLQVTGAGYHLAGEGVDGAAILTWSAAAQAEFASTHVIREAGFGSKEIGETAEASFRDASVKPGGRYRYSLVGIRPDGTRAPPSNSIEIHVPAEPPPAAP